MNIIVPADHPDYYAGAVTVRKPSGYILLDGQEVAQTSQCPHCDGHFIIRVGSGVHRTFCARCNRVTCGNRACWPCVPWEKQMLAMEARSNALRSYGLE